ncbi:Bardet-Biedl syndrome 2 protein homolog isoform X1 [Ornithodoros turicata]|uniref:Bardet-Biedl syndrome 2 protein homolog isoform X1 n=1 Tax=Ornithodoros turicata TaxID=34597 RepID=UPI00313A1FD0
MSVKLRDNLTPLFTFHLNQNILQKRVTVGKYDGVHPCLTAVTASDKVLVHNAQSRGPRTGDRWQGTPTGALSDVSVLNVNQAVTSLAAGPLKPGAKEDALVIGTPTAVLAYDVENNSDLFFKEVPDGSNTVVVGHLGTLRNPVALVGGNCSIQGFDHEGQDVFWTVTGDNVSAMTLLDYNKDGLNELLVGSEDFDIRVFREDVILTELTETEAITALCPLGEASFAYALANGTIGVYKAGERAWRIKSKNQAICLHGYDIDGDGTLELITGWSNGKVDARNIDTGEVVLKDSFGHCIAGIVQADYCQEGRDALVVCSVNGEVRGYGPTTTELRQQALDAAFEQETIRELSQRKQDLLLEMKNYEANARLGSAHQKAGKKTAEQYGYIPANTQLRTALAINPGSSKVKPHVEIALQTNNDTIIRAVIVFAEGIFQGESLVFLPREEDVHSSIRIPLRPSRDLAVDIHLKAFVGYKNSHHFHVFEVSRQLPRFSMYLPSEEIPVDAVTGRVELKLNERPQRVATWFNQNFLLPEDVQVYDRLQLNLLSARNSMPFSFTMELNGEAVITTDQMDLAAEVIQSLASYLNVEDLESRADFPEESNTLEILMVKVEEYQSTRMQLSANMANTASAIRNFVVRAEDARLMQDYDSMRKWYQELQSCNRQLISDYKIRSNSHEELMSSLRQVNQIIQRAARLRVGRAKSRVITTSRAAVQNRNVHALIKAIAIGEERPS